MPGELRVLDGLGLLPGSFSPHYDGEPLRRPSLHRMLLAAEIRAGYAADNSAAIHFVDGQVFRAIQSTPTARAYRVGVQGKAVVEEALEMMAG